MPRKNTKKTKKEESDEEAIDEGRNDAMDDEKQTENSEENQEKKDSTPPAPSVETIPLARPSSAGSRTYTSLIHEAIESLGGRGTSGEICKYIEDHYPDEVRAKTKTWKNSVCGQLSTHFSKDPNSSGRLTVWLPRDPSEKPLRYGRKSDSSDLPEIVDGEVQVKRQRKVTERAPRKPIAPPKPQKPKAQVLRRRMAELKQDHPVASPAEDEYIPSIELINKNFPLKLTEKMTHPGSVFSLSLSNDASMLASVSTLGSIRVWDCDDWKLLIEIRDSWEADIEEFYLITFIDADRKLLVSGKHKDRKRWNEGEDDNEVLPTPLKIFDVATGDLIARLDGHQEEVLSVKVIKFEGNNYIVSVGQDGKIIKWRMNEDFSALEEMIEFPDHDTSIAAAVDFIPGYNNQFLVAACDTGIKVFDFDSGMMLQDVPDLYGYLTDSIQFIVHSDIPLRENEYLLLIKGVEPLKEDENGESYIDKQNSCKLLKVTVSLSGKNASFNVETQATYQHDKYESNMWLLKLASNGRYVLSSSINGHVFVWNLKSSQLVAVIGEHKTDGLPIREIAFHPTKDILFMCSDDSSIFVYEQQVTKEGKSLIEKAERITIEKEKVDEPEPVDDSDPMEEDLPPRRSRARKPAPRKTASRSSRRKKESSEEEEEDDDIDIDDEEDEEEEEDDDDDY